MYAQKHVNPILTPEAKDVLKSFYLKLRADCKKGDSIPITTRILESMKRLTEVTEKKIKRNIAFVRIVRKSFRFRRGPNWNYAKKQLKTTH